MQGEAVIGERLKLRENLEISERIYDGEIKYFIKNMETNKFFLLSTVQYKVASYFDGKRNSEDIQCELSNDGIDISLDKLELFIQVLRKKDLFYRKSDDQSKEIESEKNSLLDKILYIRIPLMNPNEFLKKVISKIDFVFSKGTFLFLALYFFLAVGIYLQNFAPWKMPILVESNMKNLIVLVMIIGGAAVGSVFHELSHALTCMKFGGRVKEIGFLIIYFRPGLYCNISDSYMFKEKNRRLIVPLAGIIFDIFVWSTIILIGGVLKGIGVDTFFMPAFGINALLSVFLGLNPLLKLDGYYILTELLEIYNLREEAFKYLFGIIKRKEKKVKKEKARIYIMYAVTAGIYSVWIILTTINIVYKYILGSLGVWGYVILSGFVILGLSQWLIKLITKIQNNKNNMKKVI